MPSGTGEGSKATQFKPLTEPLHSRFERSYIPEPNSGCWLWTEGLDNKGYGRITHEGKMPLAHRISWKLYRGGTYKFVLHHCDTPCCVNPDHLYAGTQQDNMRDRSVRKRGADRRGEKSHTAKITAQQALDIRADTRPQSKIAKAFGISQAAVSLIKTRKNWGHI